MNWLTNFIRPKIRSIVEPREVPDNLWQKCPSCEGMLFHRDVKENLNVCYHCGHHMRIDVAQRLALLFDEGKYETLHVPSVPHDPLKFKDRKRYADRLKETRQKIGQEDAIRVARGTIGGNKAIISAFDFDFMGGSMGAAVGEGIVVGAEAAVKEKAAFLVIPCSGGARMQEGAISLMQMPRTIIAANRVRKAGLPYIVLLTDPTTGGVTASFAMTGDIHIAEPGCMIGFAGKRVIQETIREALPPGFQTAEYLLEHGMIDMVVPRKELHATIARILDLICNKDGRKPRKVAPADDTAADIVSLPKKGGGADKKPAKGPSSPAATIALRAAKGADTAKSGDDDVAAAVTPARKAASA